MALQDPYCAWDNVDQRCTAVGSPDWSAGKKRFIQSIAYGEHKACGRITTGQLKVGMHYDEQLDLQCIRFSTPKHSPQLSSRFLASFAFAFNMMTVGLCIC